MIAFQWSADNIVTRNAWQCHVTLCFFLVCRTVFFARQQFQTGKRLKVANLVPNSCFHIAYIVFSSSHNLLDTSAIPGNIRA